MAISTQGLAGLLGGIGGYDLRDPYSVDPFEMQSTASIGRQRQYYEDVNLRSQLGLDRYPNHTSSSAPSIESIPKPKTYRDELQREVDEWLKEEQ